MTSRLDIPVQWERPDEQGPTLVSVGVPLAFGQLTGDALPAAFLDEVRLPTQCRVLLSWPDGSVRWLHVYIEVPAGRQGPVTFYLRDSDDSAEDAADFERPVCTPDKTVVACGDHRLAIPHSGECLLTADAGTADPVLGESGFRPDVRDMDGRKLRYQTRKIRIVESGPVLTTVEIQGNCRLEPWLAPLKITTVVKIPLRLASVTIEFTVHNTMAAAHPDNEWDLGDPGSVFLSDVSLNWHLPGEHLKASWLDQGSGSFHEVGHDAWTLLQQSSGGPNWQSHVHVDWQGKLPTRAPGYRSWSGTDETPLASGDRASPVVAINTSSTALRFDCEHFWQNFPKALRLQSGDFSFGLFPRECGSPFELQGGESKRHRLSIYLDESRNESPQARVMASVPARVDAKYTAGTGVLPYFPASSDAQSGRYRDYLNSIIDGDTAFVARRELIDEFGWRHFGDIYADHEAAEFTGDREFVSHYNNQYDFVYTAGIHFLRSGDRRWWQLMDEAAGHMIDIDLYKTQEDRYAYNNGLFWHTEHYRDAETSSHRTYSVANREGTCHGGGPSNEQNYSSGLLLYYCLTGDERARDAVMGMADWVLAMDDGSRSLLSAVDGRPTGLASSTRTPDFHKPGRGAGNSINALLDGFDLSGDGRYLDYGEQLIERCIHPRDDLLALGLDDPEERWSYLAFLQILGKYLGGKRARAEFDRAFFYARDSLLHYAEWMCEFEVPYSTVLDRVEYPTETWPAQDIRKMHIMHLAALYSSGERREAFAARAHFFSTHCIEDVLGFATAYFARPRVLVAAYAYIHDYFLDRGYGLAEGDVALQPHGHTFDEPDEFVPQNRIAQLLTSDRLTYLFRMLRRRFFSRLSLLARNVGSGPRVRTHVLR